jgi:hypothetical protein
VKNEDEDLRIATTSPLSVDRDQFGKLAHYFSVQVTLI